MFKLIIIVVALVFALIGYRKAWYPSWAFLFNILISIYASIMITPQIVDKISFIRVYLSNFSYSAFILISAQLDLPWTPEAKRSLCAISLTLAGAPRDDGTARRQERLWSSKLLDLTCAVGFLRVSR